MSNSDTNISQNRVEVEGSGALKVINRVIKSVSVARSIYMTLRAAHLERIYLYAEIDGMIAGNPPYDVEELASAGLLHIANFNTLEPRALYEKAAQSYWNLLFTSESVIRFNIRVKDPQVKTWCEIMSRHWDIIVRSKWPSFDINTTSLCGQLVKYGLSPIVWEGNKNPFWRVVEANKFYVPDQSASDLDLLSNVCIETDYPIVFLLEIYEEYKDKRNETKWNIDVLERFLAFKANAATKDPTLPTDWVELQRKLYQGDISFDRMYNETVRLVSLFYKEGTGKISHFMFDRDFTTADTTDQGFLFLDESKHRDFREVFLLFTQSPGEMYIHGNRGLGHKMYPLCQAKMMMDNSLLDMARWSSTPVIKSGSMTVKEADAIKFIPGVMTNIGSMEFQQNNLGANLQGVVNTSQYFSSLLQQNAAFAGDDSSRPDSSMGSLAPEVFRLNSYKEFNVLRNQISHFYKSYDSLLSEMHRRLCNLTEADPGHDIFTEWRDACLEEGVPETLLVGKADKLPKYISVKATRTAGSGSQIGQLIGLKEVEPLVGTFGKRAQVSYISDKIKVALGPEFAESYTQDMLDPDEMGGGASLAVLENSIMQDGKNPLAEPSNDQQTHITVHLALGKQTEQSLLQQQLDAVQADRVFQVLIPHIQQHVGFLQNSIFAKAFLDGVKKDIYELQKLAQINRRNAERELQAQAQKQQQDQQATQETMTDAQRKDFTAQRDEQRKDFQVDKQVKRADKANEVRGEVIKRKTDAEIAAIEKKAAAGGKNNPPIEQTNASQRLSEMINQNGNIDPFDFK